MGDEKEEMRGHGSIAVECKRAVFFFFCYACFSLWCIFTFVFIRCCANDVATPTTERNAEEDSEREGERGGREAVDVSQQDSR